ncbi:MAG: LysR family transcriptional regulator [Cetobacterium sp.]|uniref:LysR family transcriptional regulator n=1 Tax=unclassified Cetobacterium TaxID=2630983 RepID=UPI00163C63ED|nr:LysR family transcriptional regulator [Cetobacterium sp. 2A]MBC2856498.1 LysR family transcriptional regulator [Cetobacterium sp. 2A]
MDLHYLKIFYEVAKEKSFTKAASKLYINQSAVSIQVKKFEELLNARLFDRSSKKIKLTYTGEALFKMAEEIFEKVKRAEKEISRIIDLDRAKISIGASPVIGEPVLPCLMKEFNKVHEEIEYDINVSNKQWLLKLLKEGELDILLLDEEHITDPNLEVITLDKVPYVLVGRREYRNIENVAKDPLISRKHIPNNNEAIAIVEERHKINFETKISVLGNLEVIKGMVREGIGNVILPYYAVHKEIESGEFKVIEEIEEIKDGYQIVITKDKKNLIQIIKFVNFVQNYKIQY